MNDDLEAIDGLCAKIIAQRDRIEALEAALREIVDRAPGLYVSDIERIARAALVGDQTTPGDR